MTQAMKTPAQVIGWWERKLFGLEDKLQAGTRSLRAELTQQGKDVIVDDEPHFVQPFGPKLQLNIGDTQQNPYTALQSSREYR
jgi:hypothetical protein